jgi:Tfp pilus assembly protein PilX
MLPCENPKQSGLVLIVVLIFLQIITILGMYAVESTIQSEKMGRLNGQQDMIFVNAEQALRMIEKNG